MTPTRRDLLKATAVLPVMGIANTLVGNAQEQNADQDLEFHDKVIRDFLKAHTARDNAVLLDYTIIPADSVQSGALLGVYDTILHQKANYAGLPVKEAELKYTDFARDVQTKSQREMTRDLCLEMLLSHSEFAGKQVYGGDLYEDSVTVGLIVGPQDIDAIPKIESSGYYLNEARVISSFGGGPKDTTITKMTIRPVQCDNGLIIITGSNRKRDELPGSQLIEESALIPYS